MSAADERRPRHIQCIPCCVQMPHRPPTAMLPPLQTSTCLPRCRLKPRGRAAQLCSGSACDSPARMHHHGVRLHCTTPCAAQARPPPRPGSLRLSGRQSKEALWQVAAAAAADAQRYISSSSSLSSDCLGDSYASVSCVIDCTAIASFVCLRGQRQHRIRASRARRACSALSCCSDACKTSPQKR